MKVLASRLVGISRSLDLLGEFRHDVRAGEWRNW